MISKTYVDSNQAVIFGPVPSRRLGMSLGVDVVPMKFCSYDCIYCELGKTTQRTIERKEYIQEGTVIRALERYFAEKHGGRLDYVTFSGSGEPTLNLKIGTFIHRLKELTKTPIAVLTNGSLLNDPEVRDNLMEADLIIPSLDAVEQKTFIKVNQPVVSLEVSDIVWGIRQLSKEFKGEIWLEILLVKGVNDHPDHIRKLSEAALWINPRKIQLTTVVRPPRHGVAPALAKEELYEIAKKLNGNVEVVGDFDRRESPGYREEKRDRIEAMLKIRPMTLEDIARTTGMHRAEALKYLDQLRAEHVVRDETYSGSVFFTIDRE